jgi:HTH-type transcriptional regulator / antitoxin HigA
VEQPADFFPRLQALCLEAGVKVVYTPCLPKAPIHGSTRWIHDTPLLQLSARYRQNDIFWFTFFHEVGHILLHGKKYVSLENISYDDLDRIKEQEADDFAVKYLFSKEQEQAVLEASSSKVTLQAILAFAQKFQTHPGIIIGRFHHTKQLSFAVGRKYIVPIALDSPTKG